MSARLGEGVGASIERWLSGLSGPAVGEDEPAAPNGYEQPAAGNGYEQPAGQYDPPPNPRADGYDEDFEYYWGNVRIPLWIALIWQVPWRQRLDIFVVGLIVGLIVAGIAVLWGLVLAQY